MGRIRSVAVWGTMLVAVLGVALPAAAQDTSAMVLGIRSFEGDDEFARDLTSTLRHAASQVPGWDVSSREVSLAQMSLAHGCEEPDAACMAEIARTLGVSRVIYGFSRRTSAGDDYNYAISLFSFNGQTGQIEGSISDTIQRGLADVDNLRNKVRDYVAQLTGQPRTGALRVAVNVPGAQVLIDGEAVGTADPSGTLVASEVASGRRRVEVVADGHQTFRGTVSVVPDDEVSLEVTLIEEGGTSSGGGGASWLGIGLVGLSAVGLGVAVYSMATLDGLNGDEEYMAYRRTIPDGDDVCAAARAAGPMDMQAAHAVSICDEADTFEILQYVGFGVAAVAGGLGIYFLATSGGGGEEEPAVSVRPRFHADGGSVTTTLRF